MRILHTVHVCGRPRAESSSTAPPGSSLLAVQMFPLPPTLKDECAPEFVAGAGFFP